MGKNLVMAMGFVDHLGLCIFSRAATRSKTARTAVLPEFCEIEHGGSSGGVMASAAVVWLFYLPRIYRGGPVLYS